MTESPESSPPEPSDATGQPADNTSAPAAEQPPPAFTADTAAAGPASGPGTDPFGPAVPRVKTRWINPRRQWATVLIAVGAAIVLFVGGAAAGFHAAHGGPFQGRAHASMNRSGEMPGGHGVPGRGEPGGDWMRGGTIQGPAAGQQWGPRMRPFGPRLQCDNARSAARPCAPTSTQEAPAPPTTSRETPVP